MCVSVKSYFSFGLEYWKEMSRPVPVELSGKEINTPSLWLLIEF